MWNYKWTCLLKCECMYKLSTSSPHFKCMRRCFLLKVPASFPQAFINFLHCWNIKAPFHERFKPNTESEFSTFWWLFCCVAVCDDCWLRLVEWCQLHTQQGVRWSGCPHALCSPWPGVSGQDLVQGICFAGEQVFHLVPVAMGFPLWLL